MKTTITFLKTMLFIFAITASITLQAQEPVPVVQLQLENNLNASGGFTFEAYDPDNIGFTIPYSSTNFAEGSYALDFSKIAAESADESLIQNGHVADIRSTTNLNITGSDARTVSAWIRYANKNTDTNGSHTIVNLGDPSSSSLGRTTFTFAAGNNRLELGVGGGNVKHNYTDGEGIEDGDWHHVAFTYPSGGTLADVIYYVDGLAVTDDDAGANSAKVLETTSDLVYVGSNGKNGTKWFDGGGIDDLRIYDVALTPTQIATVYGESYLNTADISFAKNEIKAYPNPVEDILYIETTSNSTLDINVFDITGKLVLNTNKNAIDMGALSSGLYIVKVREGNKVANLKTLKK
jgi:hypothetical protein